MNIKILNYELIEKDIDFRGLSHLELETAFNELFTKFKFPLNIIFVKPELIKQLNNDFRKKDEATDVLSFEAPEEGGVAEVYVCPEIVLERLKAADVCTPDMVNKRLFLKELLRITIHGILHISGHEHTGYFTGPFDVATNQTISATMEKSDSEMFSEQEENLKKLLKLINIGE